jgi:hypothetical protein
MNPALCARFGFYSIYAVAHRAASAASTIALYAHNTLGKQYLEEDIDKLARTADQLGISPARWWDDRSVTTERLQETLQALFGMGRVRVARRAIRSCACGKIEMLAQVTPYGTKTLIQKGLSRCCTTALTTEERPVLLTSALPYVRPSVYPVWAARELFATRDRLQGSSLLLSRSTPRPFSVLLDGRRWYLDTDIVWALLAVWMREEGRALRELVVGVSTLRQALIVAFFAALADAPPLEQVYCVPKVYFQPVHGVDTLQRAVARFGSRRVVHALLWAALSERKEYTLHGGTFPRMRDVEVSAPITVLRSALCV